MEFGSKEWFIQFDKLFNEYKDNDWDLDEQSTVMFEVWDNTQPVLHEEE